jgi:hypothetical protein
MSEEQEVTEVSELEDIDPELTDASTEFRFSW